jgi:hypothetical protein
MAKIISKLFRTSSLEAKRRWSKIGNRGQQETHAPPGRSLQVTAHQSWEVGWVRTIWNDYKCWTKLLDKMIFFRPRQSWAWPRSRSPEHVRDRGVQNCPALRKAPQACVHGGQWSQVSQSAQLLVGHQCAEESRRIERQIGASQLNADGTSQFPARCFWKYSLMRRTPPRRLSDFHECAKLLISPASASIHHLTPSSPLWVATI